MDEISFQIRNIIVQEFSRLIAGSGIPVLDMAANTQELGKMLADGITSTIAEYGLSLPELYIENISLPPAVEKALDKRTSMGVIGNLDAYTKFQAAEALGQEGSAAGQAMGTGFGAGLGMSMGAQMSGAQGGGQAGPWGARPAASAPPPPPPPPV